MRAMLIYGGLLSDSIIASISNTSSSWYTSSRSEKIQFQISLVWPTKEKAPTKCEAFSLGCHLSANQIGQS
jgi:hypothetical protein